jgi:hypothetical protein
MTRINAGILPSRLSNKHLLAEHREIKRIPNQVSKERYTLKGIPKEFCLGTGHVKFFYDKLGYLLVRYQEIHQECKRRGFQVQDWSGAWNGVPPCLMNGWIPENWVIGLLEERIRERGGFPEDRVK